MVKNCRVGGTPSTVSGTFVGISGWRYPPWRGVFYPSGLPQDRELEYASRALPTIEINGTFYSLQKPESFQHWYEATPPGFIFSVKGPRYITHVRRLRDVHGPLANFFASGLFNLREKLGPILWQFPPSFRYEPERMKLFFELLPHDTQQALSLARRREHRMTGRARLAVDATRTVRHAIEIRNESFIDETFVQMLREHNIAFVVADTAGKWPYREDVTADFLYLRLHGDKKLYASGYTDEALARWAARIRAWRAGSQPEDAHLISAQSPLQLHMRDVYCYFDNDIKVRAPFDAKALIAKL
ncbi:Uncharacterized conserved protein YecE, DUF72 family [Nitrosospira sp. Nsp11]|nr:Uncharacterized conserved protein YecE, DUF72 family [Nitrosospira sp. Nsp11]